MSKRSREGDELTTKTVKYTKLVNGDRQPSSAISSSSGDSDSEESGSNDIDPAAAQNYTIVHEKLRKELNPLYPHFKKHLGSQLAVTMKDKLLDIDPFDSREEMEQVCEQNLELARALVASWTDAPKKLLTEEEKEVLRGEDTVNAWGEEIIEMEIAAGAMYCPLKLLNDVETEGDEEEEEEFIPMKEVSIHHFRSLPFIMTSFDVSEFEKALSDKLDSDCNGDIASNISIILDNWNDGFKQVTQNLDKENYTVAFSFLFALTNLMKSLDHWYSNNDDLETIKQTMETLQNLWNRALTKSNTELGISGKDDLRAHLKNYLDSFANEVKTETGNQVAFSWKIISN